MAKSKLKIDKSENKLLLSIAPVLLVLDSAATNLKFN